MKRNSFELGLRAGREFPPIRELLMTGVLLSVDAKKLLPLYRKADEKGKMEIAENFFVLFCALLVRSLPSGIYLAISPDTEEFIRGIRRGMEIELGKDPVQIVKETLDLLELESMLRDPEEAKLNLLESLAENI